MIIVALDPGETTGFVQYDTEAEQELACGEVFGNFKGCIDLILSMQADLYILEDFKLRPGVVLKISEIYPTWWRAIFEYFELPLVVQTPAQAKWLKNVTGASAHEADARRHLRVWLNKQGKDYKDKLKEAIKRELGNEG